jgi:hypothetical protein
LNFACCTAEFLLHELLWPKVAQVYRASFRLDKNTVGISSRLSDQKLVYVPSNTSMKDFQIQIPPLKTVQIIWSEISNIRLITCNIKHTVPGSSLYILKFFFSLFNF